MTRIAPAGQSAIETHFVYDGDALVLELSPNGQPLVQYVQGLLGPIARVDLQTPSNTRYYVLDARGQARAETGGRRVFACLLRVMPLCTKRRAWRDTGVPPSDSDRLTLGRG